MVCDPLEQIRRLLLCRCHDGYARAPARIHSPAYPAGQGAAGRAVQHLDPVTGNKEQTHFEPILISRCNGRGNRTIYQNDNRSRASTRIVGPTGYATIFDTLEVTEGISCHRRRFFSYQPATDISVLEHPWIRRSLFIGAVLQVVT